MEDLFKRKWCPSCIWQNIPERCRRAPLPPFFGIEYNRLWNNCLLAHVMCLTFYFPSSGPELPDAVCRHGSEPGPVQPKRTERLRPEASLPPDHSVRIWPHHTHQRTMAQTPRVPCDGQHANSIVYLQNIHHSMICFLTLFERFILGLSEKHCFYSPPSGASGDLGTAVT